MLKALTGYVSRLVLAIFFASGTLWAEEGERDHAAREAAKALLDQGRTEAAVVAFARLAEEHSEDPLAWFELAQAQHTLGDYEAAHESGARAASFPEIRAVSLYNMACASARLGSLDRAVAELQEAVANGFVDFDLLAVDPDMQSLRETERLPLSPAQHYETLRHGSVKLSYRVVLPEDYDPARRYPAILAFSPGGGGARSTDWTLATLWADAEARADWIVVCAVEPSNGWINHPSHHALNALMRSVCEQHEVETERFHLLGLGAGGRAAATYSLMSRRQVASLTLVDSLPFASWDDEEVIELAEKDVPVRLLVAARGEDVVREARRVQRLLEEAGGDVGLELVDDTPALLPTMDLAHLLSRVAVTP